MMCTYTLTKSITQHLIKAFLAAVLGGWRCAVAHWHAELELAGRRSVIHATGGHCHANPRQGWQWPGARRDAARSWAWFSTVPRLALPSLPRSSVLGQDLLSCLTLIVVHSDYGQIKGV